MNKVVKQNSISKEMTGMLVHHSQEDYQIAASKAASAARGKMEALIAGGATKAQRVLEQITNQVPQDFIVQGNSLQFQIGSTGSLELASSFRVPAVGSEKQCNVFPLHEHAVRQLAERRNFPMKYLDYLMEPENKEFGPPLITKNLNELYHNTSHRYLVRVVEGAVRGFLSDKYRRLDSRPLVDAFAQACQFIGAMPVEGHALDTQVALKAMLPMVFEPVPNEVMCFGLNWRNSDFADGAHEIEFFVLRLWCTNFAQVTDVLRQVHIGRRLADDFVYSNQTYTLDTKATASAIGDTVRAALGPAAVNSYLDAIRQVNEEKLDQSKAKEFLKARLLKGEVEQVLEAFNSPDVEMLPPGNTVWRMSNAISWVAGKQEDKKRLLEMEHYAGELLPQFRIAA